MPIVIDQVEGHIEPERQNGGQDTQQESSPQQEKPPFEIQEEEFRKELRRNDRQYARLRAD